MRGSVKERGWMDLLTRVFSYENKSIVTDGTLETSEQRIGTSLSESRDDFRHTHSLGAAGGIYKISLGGSYTH